MTIIVLIHDAESKTFWNTDQEKILLQNLSMCVVAIQYEVFLQ